MEKKHTPAPWLVNPRATRNVRHGNTTIANCSSGQNGSREAEEIANAKLIAAAPELLDALSNIVSNYKIGNEDNYIMANLIDKAELLINKATKP